MHEIESVGSPYSVLVLEDFAPRPLKAMPQAILDDLALSQVSIFAAQAQAAAKGRGVLLHVDPMREAARRLYLRKGFSEIGTEGADIAMVWRPS